MEKKKITKKTNEEKVSLKDKILNSIKNFFNKPAPLFITLIIIIFVLLMYISSILSSRDIFVGEVEKADLRINNIHYYTDGNNRYFYADPAEYTAEDKLIYEYQIGYFVKNNKGELIELASRSGGL